MGRKERKRVHDIERRFARDRATWRGWKPPCEWMVSLRLHNKERRIQFARSYETAKESAERAVCSDPDVESAWVVEMRSPRK